MQTTLSGARAYHLTGRPLDQCVAGPRIWLSSGCGQVAYPPSVPRVACCSSLIYLKQRQQQLLAAWLTDCLRSCRVFRSPCAGPQPSWTLGRGRPTLIGCVARNKWFLSDNMLKKTFSTLRPLDSRQTFILFLLLRLSFISSFALQTISLKFQTFNRPNSMRQIPSSSSSLSSS